MVKFEIGKILRDVEMFSNKYSIISIILIIVILVVMISIINKLEIKVKNIFRDKK